MLCFTTAMAGAPLAAVAMETVGRSTSPSASMLEMACFPWARRELTSPTAMVVITRAPTKVTAPSLSVPPTWSPSARPHSRVTARRRTQLRTEAFTTPPRASFPVWAM